MADTMRDPRVTPKRGDVTISPCGERFTILAASKGIVKWRRGSDGYVDSADLSDWQKWSKDDQVERRAQ